MRTLERARLSRGGIGFMRVGTLLALAALVWMLASVAREPRHWNWLAPDEQPQAKLAEQKTEVPALATGPADDDSEQWEAAREEFQAVSDGTLSLLPEEMPAYWRLFHWSQNQPAKLMLQRAQTSVTLDDMMQRPEQQRGKLVRLDLHVRRLLKYDAPQNSNGIETIYELWGWSEATKSWLYVGVTTEKPEGMPLGADIHERVTFVGYFLKIQGYRAAQSKPNEKPLSAPLLVGRMIWHPPEVAAESTSEPWWLWGGAGLLAVGILAATVWPLFRQRRAAAARRLPATDINLEDAAAADAAPFRNGHTHPVDFN